MTRKDYIKIAEVLEKYDGQLPLAAFDHLVCNFCEMLKRDNPNFKAEVFKRAVYGS